MVKNWRVGTTAIAVLVVIASAALCSAETPQKMNYQAMLTDNNDQPLINQPVEIEFTIWSAATGGGSPLWTESHSTATNWIGVVSVVLGNVNPIDVDFSSPRWLQVEVDGEILTPRREMVGASYALYDESGGTGDGFSLDASDGSPVDALYVDGLGNVGVGTTSPQSDLHVNNELQVGSTVYSGKLTVESSSSCASVFDGGASGNASVVLPEDAIGSYEILNEPGVSSATEGGGADFTGSMQYVGLRSLSPPSDGYVLAIGTVQVAIEHPGGGVSSTVRLGLTDTYPSYPSNQDCYVKVPGDAPAGDYHHTVTVHGLFPMVGGQTKSFYFYANRLSGSNGYYRNVQLTLLFVPTTYGTVEPMGAPAAGPEDESAIEQRIGVGGGAGHQADTEAVAVESTDETSRLIRELMDRVEELERQQTD